MVVPGIGTIHGFRASSQPRAIWAGVARFSAAIRVTSSTMAWFAFRFSGVKRGTVLRKSVLPKVVKLIALEKEPMAWEADVKALKTPVLIIAGDADVATLVHSVAMFRLLGGGGMGDMAGGKPLPASRLAILPATSHTAVITQVDLLHRFIEPFLKGQTPKGFFEQ